MASDLRLLVVGDIFGQPTAMDCLSSHLPSAKVTRCDLATLCGHPDLRGEALHRHLFTKGAIQRVVQALCARITEPTFALGYSAGGTALWQAAHVAPICGLVCVSSTRLRDEHALSVPTACIFGQNDPNRPNDHWCATVPDTTTILPDAEHSFYTDANAASVKNMRLTAIKTLALWSRN